MELRTQKQIERDDRDKQLAKLFVEIKRKNPLVSNSRIMVAMAEDKTLGFSSMSGIRSSLIRTRTI